MDCRSLRSLLPECCEGTLSEPVSEAAHRHLADCPDCRKAYEELRDFDSQVAEFLVCPAPAYRTEDLLKRLDDVAAIGPVAEATPALDVGRAAPRYAAAALFLLGLAGFGSVPRIDRAALANASEKLAARDAEIEEAIRETEAYGREESA